MINLHEIQSRHGLKVAEGYDADVDAKTLLLPIGALQKVLLSQIDSKGLDSALKSIINWSAKDRTTTNLERLKQQLKIIKEEGYAISSGERIRGAYVYPPR
jgi:DNA-binding IclR family transcriptional regulator